MIIVGFTGGIATGKSTVIRLAEQLTRDDRSVAFVDSDEIARLVVQKGRPALQLIVKHFGAKALTTSGELDRAYIGSIVFKDAEQRHVLNQCTHPYIRREIMRQTLVAYLRGYRMAILDIPLLYEAHLEPFMGPPEQQLDRLERRDTLSTADAQARIGAQMPLGEKARRANVVIDNAGSVDRTEAQVAAFLRRYMPSRLRTAVLWAAGWWAAALALGALQVIDGLPRAWMSRLRLSPPAKIGAARRKGS